MQPKQNAPQSDWIWVDLLQVTDLTRVNRFRQVNYILDLFPVAKEIARRRVNRVGNGRTQEQRQQPFKFEGWDQFGRLGYLCMV